MLVQSKKARMLFIVGALTLLVAGVAAVLVLSPDNTQRQKDLIVEYKTLSDSLTATEQKIRDAEKPEIISLHKDRLTLFQNRIAKIRTELDKILTHNSDPTSADVQDSSAAHSETALPSSLPPILWYSIGGTAFVLILAIVGLLYLIKRGNMPSPAKAKRSEGKIKFEFAPKTGELDEISIPDPIVVEKKGSKSASQAKAQSMKELEAFFAQQNARDYSADFGHTQELEALYPKVAPRTDASSPSLKELYPSTLKKMEKEDKEKSDILKLARRGYTSSDIARRLRISQDQIELFLKMHRERQ